MIVLVIDVGHRSRWAASVTSRWRGDRGIAEIHGCELDLDATIANGDGVCQIRFVRREGEARPVEA